MAKRTSKLDSSANFALDRLNLRSVRPKDVKNMIFTAAKEGGPDTKLATYKITNTGLMLPSHTQPYLFSAKANKQ